MSEKDERAGLMAYIDDAKRAAGDERTSGEPLAAFIARVITERDARASEAARLRAEVERLTGNLEAERAAHYETAQKLTLAERDAADVRAALEMTGDDVRNLRKALAVAEHSLEHLREQLTAADAVTPGLYRIADSLGAKLPPVEDREADDARLRISLGVAELQERAGKLERSRDFWQAKAGRLERRVAVLTEERDGLTMRLGEKVHAEMQASSTAPGAKRRKAPTRKRKPAPGGRVPSALARRLARRVAR